MRSLRFSEKFDLPLILAAAFLFQAYLLGPLLFHGDTMYIFQTFYVFYNQLFLAGEFVQWLPYGSLGLGSGWLQMNYLAPAQYAAGLIGAAFHVRDVLMLFKVSVLCEQIPFLFGAYLLGRRLFRRRAAVFFLCFGLAAGSFWFLNLSWNFRLAAMLPLVLALLLEGFERKDPLFFWASGIVFILGHLGVPPYFVMLNSLIVVIFLTAFLVMHRRALAFLVRPSPRYLAGLAVFLGIAAAVLYFVLHLLKGVVIHVPDRGASGQVSLETFNTFGQGVGMEKFISLFFPGYVGMSFQLYCGLLPLGFLLYAFLRVRKPLFHVTAGVLIWLVLLSAGFQSPAAAWTYHLYPPLHYFRGVGCIGALIRFFLLLGAAFGVNHYLEVTGRPQASRKEKIWLVISAAAVLGAAAALLTFGHPEHFIDPQDSAHLGRWLWPHYAWTAGALTAAACLILTGRRPFLYGLAAVVFLAADLGGVHVLFARHWTLNTSSRVPSVFQVVPQPFSPYRGLTPGENSRMREANEKVRSTKSILANEYFSFLGFDGCFPYNFSPMLWTQGVDELLQLRFPFFGISKVGETMSPEDQLTYTRVAGCADTKLRLTNRVSLAATHDEAVALVRRLPDFGIQHVVETEAGEMPASGQGLSEPEPYEAGKAYRTPEGDTVIDQPLGTVHVTAFSYNRLQASVKVKAPGVWLYYADANHPGWKAFLDGRDVPIANADLGFKAVRIPEGEHTVEFRFWNGLQSGASAAVALLAAAYAGMLLFFLIFTVLRLPGSKEPQGS